MMLVPYLRTSTDDRGQNPLRQSDLIASWAKQNDIRLLSAVVDDGTSASKHPDALSRYAFKEAVAQAKGAEGCAGIVVDVIDRLTRGGVESWVVTKYLLQQEHGLVLYHAETPPDQQTTAAGEFYSATKAMVGRVESENLKRRIKSGMDRARANGKRMGRPPKPIPQDEVEYAVKLRAEGLGWDAIAARVNKRRGVQDYATPEVRKKKSTSGPSVRRAVMAFRPSGTLHKSNPTKVLEASEDA